MVKGSNKKTSLSKLKEKKSITNEQKKKTFAVTSFFKKRLRTNQKWPV